MSSHTNLRAWETSRILLRVIFVSCIFNKLI